MVFCCCVHEVYVEQAARMTTTFVTQRTLVWFDSWVDSHVCA